MNEDRLPSWVHLSITNGAGSPRRVAQFDDHDRHKQSSESRARTSSRKDLPNPFVSPSLSNSYDLVEHHLNANRLVMYCRQGLWDQALERCESHPEEALPRRCQPDFFEERWSPFQPFGSEKVSLYEQTPLGILCNSSELNQVPHQTLVELVNALVSQGNLVSASQKTKGNTPLRQAIRNPICPPSVIETLLRQSDASMALHLPDEHGVYPLDHLLQRVRRQTAEEDQRSLLHAFIRNAPLESFACARSYSPLVRFYSTVTNGADGLQQSWRLQLTLPNTNMSFATARDGVVLSTQMLLNAIPQLLSTPSKTTGCMPIHAALRNYGNRADLIQVLLTSNSPEKLLFMLHRNNFGDLPLHVACACGVSLPVLKLVLTRTVQAASPLRMYENPVLWSTNHAGYTPIDLEWIRHIEAGNGFLSHVVFRPIGVEGIPRPRGRYDDLYDKLLRQAVDQLITSKTERSRTTHVATQDVFGLLLHRVFLIIRAAFHDSFSQSPFDLSGDILHQASALFQPRGPSTPEAIMDLLLWQYPEQIDSRDHLNRTPLHHALSICESSELLERKSVAWERWVRKLIQKSSLKTIRAVDGRGRNVLHTVLGTRQDPSEIPSCPQVGKIVLHLANLHPEAIHVRDPVTRLFPALQAASNDMVPLDTVYWLLRRAPRLIQTL